MLRSIHLLRSAAGKSLQHKQAATNIFSSAFSTQQPDEPASAIDWINGEQPVVVFGKTWCGFSTKAKSLFQQIDVDFVSVELDTREDGDAIQAELAELTGMRTVPSVWIDGKFIGGYSELSKVPPKEIQFLVLQRMINEASK